MGVAGCPYSAKPSAEAPGAPHMLRPFQAGLLATPFEIPEGWQHRFDMNMQIRILKSPTSCLWIFLKNQPLTMTNKKQRRKKKWSDLHFVSPTDLLVLEPKHFSEERERRLGSH